MKFLERTRRDQVRENRASAARMLLGITGLFLALCLLIPMCVSMGWLALAFWVPGVLLMFVAIDKVTKP